MLINIPKIVSYVLFMNLRSKVTYYSIIYQIVWYSLFSRNGKFVY